jgi:hypothetical protein
MNWRLAIFAVLFAAGCQSTQTRQHSNELIKTTSDLYYQQVVDNLAVLGANPGTLPFFGIPQSGSETNMRMLSTSWTPGWDFIESGTYIGRYLFDKQTANLQGQVANTQAFQLLPVYDPDKLLLIQIALRMALGDQTLTINDTSKIAGFYYSRPVSLGLPDEYFQAITGKPFGPERAKLDSLWTAQNNSGLLEQDATAKKKALQDNGVAAEQLKVKVKQAEEQVNQAKTDIEKLQAQNLETAVKAQLQLSENQQAAAQEASETASRLAAQSEIAFLAALKSAGYENMESTDSSVHQADWLIVAPSKKELPKCACFISRCCNFWVAVRPERMPEFALFTAAILDLATISTIPVLAPHAPPQANGGATGPAPPKPASRGPAPPAQPRAPAAPQTSVPTEPQFQLEPQLTPRIMVAPFPPPPSI